MHEIKIGTRVVHRGGPEEIAGKVVSVEPRRIYSGPKAGPYRVRPVATVVYLVRTATGSVHRFMHIDGQACPIEITGAEVPDA